MSSDNQPPDDRRDHGQSESVGPPVPDDAPPRRGPQPFVWIAAAGVAAVCVAALLIALAIGVLA